MSKLQTDKSIIIHKQNGDSHLQMKYNIIPVFKLNFQIPKFNMHEALHHRVLHYELNPCGLTAFIRLLCHSHSTVVKLFPVTFHVVQSKKKQT